MRTVFKLTLLSISLLTIMSSAAIAPALQEIHNHFSTASSLTIQMVISLPAIFTIPVSLSVGKLNRYFGKKTLVVTGAILYIVGGLGGFFATSITMLLVLRSVLGIGVGLLLPLSTGLIADSFEGEERRRMMGYSTSFNNLGGIIATVFAGLLASVRWNLPFLVYILGFVTFFMVVMFLPKQEKIRDKAKTIITRNVWLLGIGHLGIILTFFVVPSGLSFYVVQSGLGSSSTVGMLIAIVTLGSFITGLFFSKIHNILKHNTAIVGLTVVSFAMLMIGMTQSIQLITIALLVLGIGLGVAIPNIYYKTSIAADKMNVTISLAVVSSFSFLGQFLSPLYIDTLRSVFGLEQLNAPFVLSFLTGMFGVLVLFINKYMGIYTIMNKEV